jgi:hypothetical protein
MPNRPPLDSCQCCACPRPVPRIHCMPLFTHAACPRIRCQSWRILALVCFHHVGGCRLAIFGSRATTATMPGITSMRTVADAAAGSNSPSRPSGGKPSANRGGASESRGEGLCLCSSCRIPGHRKSTDRVRKYRTPGTLVCERPSCTMESKNWIHLHRGIFCTTTMSNMPGHTHGKLAALAWTAADAPLDTCEFANTHVCSPARRFW